MFRVVKVKKIIPMPRPFTSLTLTKYSLYSTRQFDTLSGLGSLGQSISIPCTFMLYADPKQCLYVGFALVLFAYCYKKNITKKYFFSLLTKNFPFFLHIHFFSNIYYIHIIISLFVDFSSIYCKK